MIIFWEQREKRIPISFHLFSSGMITVKGRNSSLALEVLHREAVEARFHRNFGIRIDVFGRLNTGLQRSTIGGTSLLTLLYTLHFLRTYSTLAITAVTEPDSEVLSKS